MKYIPAIIGFAAWLHGCWAFNNGHTGIWLVDGDQVYTFGELWYQVGLMIMGIGFGLSVRWDAVKWWWKLIFNWIIEIFIICLWFTVFDNPYHINWNELLMCEISLCGMLVFYFVCYLFPGARKFII